ncbi:hypothetical protein RvY_16445-2 [Ramazzottius varieornatus]|uniref:glutathione transferase n=1 Tax=Ramazzottius varieornatus TaxID=947166 RepID=A0A1D1VYH0_RAMVA|nr:hypothetical protein RvY_16445-2 [Ramazzottius varieornatus]
MAPMIFGYWDVRGIFQPIRYVLEHVGEQYEFKSYSVGTNTWFEQKASLGMDFPNLPYLIDGDVQLTQSNAILHYLGKKYGLVAKNEKDQRIQDMFDGMLWDITYGAAMFFYPHMRGRMYPDGLEEGKSTYLNAKIKPKLEELDRWMANKRYIFGDTMHYNDFVLFERLDAHHTAFPDLLAQYPNLQRFYHDMLNEKGVETVLGSDKWSKAFNGPQADWGGPEGFHQPWDPKTRSYVTDGQ